MSGVVPPPILVYAVMITGKDAQRYALARQSLQSFHEQTYFHRRLIVVNDGPRQFFLQDPPRGVTELRIDPVRSHQPRLPLSNLRNIALDHIAQLPPEQPDQKRAVIQWDDDDYSHPQRIEYQLSQWSPGKAVLLLHEIQCNLHSGDAFVGSGHQQRSGGYSGTILHDADVLVRYKEGESRREDVAFALVWKHKRLLRICKNDPKLYVRMAHGKNTWSIQHIMHRMPQSRSLTEEERNYVSAVRSKYACLPAQTMNL